MYVKAAGEECAGRRRIGIGERERGENGKGRNFFKDEAVRMEEEEGRREGKKKGSKRQIELQGQEDGEDCGAEELRLLKVQCEIKSRDPVDSGI